MLKNQKAFTMVELMVAIAILTVVVSLALPNFNKQVLNSKSVALGEDIITALNLARYESVKRAKRVTICASSNSTTTSPSCTGSWTDGYIMFVDEATSDGATAPVLGSTPTIIKVFDKADPKAVMDVKNGTTAVTFIRYTALGSLARISNSLNSIVITSRMQGCGAIGKAREITVGLSGLVAVKKTNCP